jgi:uncharacterized protein (TIGR02118 family)
MPTKISFIYENPQDVDAFEADYPSQLALAKRIPGLLGVETARVWPKEDGSPTPAYRLVDLYFSDYDAASEAVGTEQAGAFFPSVFALATNGVRIVFADVEDSHVDRATDPAQQPAAAA